MRVFPSETFQASSSRTRKLLKSSISKVPPTKNMQEIEIFCLFSLLNIQVCGDCPDLLLLCL